MSTAALVAGHRKGDEPTDEPDPSLIEHDVVWKLDAATRALLRETRARLEDELGHALDDATFVDVLCRRATEDVAHDGTVPRPSRMIHLTTCRRCETSMQHGAGAAVAITRAELERAECDAVIVDDEQGKRAASNIPPTMRRFIFERDQYRCRFPGCRSARNLDIHHVEHQAHGGDHRSGNLCLLCGGHHKLHHDDVVMVRGDADGELVFTRHGVEVRSEAERGLMSSTARLSDAASGLSRYREVERNTLAKTALQQSGYKPAVAARAVERAATLVAKDAPLDVLLKEAFQHCS